MGRMLQKIRSAGKDLAFRSYCAALAPQQTNRLAARGLQRLSVLCYHRVNDTLKDNVTVSIDSFHQQMAFIRRRYQIAAVADIVAGRLDRHSRFPIVAVTFDDGYKDNYEHAVPILRRYGIPAAFFISTGIVGTDRGFEHDRAQLGFTPPSLSWDEVRQMHALGFEIGSHTVNHIDLAAVDEAEARRELTVARDTIRAELGLSEIPFAYCFGGRQHITPDRRELVRALGYSCCFAAYGGTNTGPLDLFEIRRFGVNWAFSMSAFQARIEGWG